MGYLNQILILSLILIITFINSIQEIQDGIEPNYYYYIKIKFFLKKIEFLFYFLCISRNNIINYDYFYLLKILKTICLAL